MQTGIEPAKRVTVFDNVKMVRALVRSTTSSKQSVTRYAGSCRSSDVDHGFADSPVATFRHPFGIQMKMGPPTNKLTEIINKA
jgi:hypothetical protein